jgi:hypothetical protein
MKKTLSRAASTAKTNFNQFLGMNQETPQQNDEPYWMRDDFWEGQDVEMQSPTASPSAPPIDMSSIPKQPAFNPGINLRLLHF